MPLHSVFGELSNEDGLNNTVCDSLLFGMYSIEKNPKMEYLICPDTYMSVGITSVFLFYYLSLIFLSIIGLILKQNSKSIRARNLSHPILTILSSVFFVTILTARTLIGRKVFPCAIYSWCFCLGPIMTLPSTCRCIRVFSSYKLNKVKMMLFENQTLKGSNSNKKSLEMKNSSSIDFNDVKKHDSNNEVEAYVEKVESSKSLSDQSADTYNMEIPEAFTGGNDAKVDYTLSKENASQFKIKTLQFFTSYKFVAVVYICSFLFNSLFWLLMAGIEFGVDKTGKKFENGASQLFVYPGMFEFRFGCVLTINGLILVASLALMYFIFEAISIVLLLMADRDAWNIKRESIVIIITQVIGLSIFVILGNIPGYITLVDYIIPYSLFLFFCASLEIIITVLRPIGWEIYFDYFKNRSRNGKSNDASKNVETQVANNLEDEIYFQQLLDFARRCYCPESLLCWKSIQNYKNENYHNKRMAAEFILEQFLTIGAPTELNIENIELRKGLIISKIQIEEYHFGMDLFDEIEVHCLNDLSDLIHRFKFSNQKK